MMEIDKILAPKKELISSALLKVKNHLLDNRKDLALEILESQLSWLLEIIESNSAEQGKLNKIKLGQLAAREIETLDFELAEDLYDIQEVLETLKSG